MRAKEQAATVAYLILRAQALAAANMTLNLVLEQVPAVVALRKQALTRAATVWRCRCRLFAPLSAALTRATASLVVWFADLLPQYRQRLGAEAA